ncbi:hypothetical protein SNOUR_09355 [Streptomyces noursei ATCC 11455]|nr:hypothetical protein SNOUR_09355 [Streptomyces noursei ATCC 11455]
MVGRTAARRALASSALERSSVTGMTAIDTTPVQSPDVDRSACERREILERTRHEVLARIAGLRGARDVLETKNDFYAGARRASEGA